MIDAASSFGMSSTNTPFENKDALTKAIVHANGGEVYVAQGVYPINPIAVTVPGTHLRFAPGAVLQVAPDIKLHPSLINILASNVTIEGGEFDGDDKAGAYGVMAIRIQGSVSNIVIRNCVVRNASTGIGAYNVTGCTNWTIEGCTIHATVGSHGIFLHGQPKGGSNVVGVRICRNTILNTKDNGIWIGNHFSDVIVSDNLIAAAGRMGIEVWQNRQGRFVIKHNIIREVGSFGISIAGTPNTICAGNIVHRSTGYGIEVANCHFVTLIGNDIDTVLTKDGGVKPTGIALNSSRTYALGDISIQGGTITGCVSAINVCGDKGARADIAIDGVVIRECTHGIRNVGIVGKNDGGGQVEDIVVTGCTINCLGVGIGNSVYGGLIRGGVISGNNIHAIEGQGIDLFRPAELLVIGNRIRGEDKEKSIGIRVWDHTSGTLRAHDVTVKDNHIIRFAVPHFYSGITLS